MVKDCVIGLRCSRETKDLFGRMAERRGIPVSQLILGLIFDGIALEKQRRTRIRQLIGLLGKPEAAELESLIGKSS